MRNNRQAKRDATKKSSAAQSTKTPRPLRLKLSRAARKTLNALVRETGAQLSPETRAKLRAFAKQHGYRYRDALEAAVVLTAVNHGESTEVA
jgi:type IV pilus biogenesis protein CpaD/CtpE